jgi:hypothetical protein
MLAATRRISAGVAPDGVTMPDLAIFSQAPPVAA